MNTLLKGYVAFIELARVARLLLAPSLLSPLSSTGNLVLGTRLGFHCLHVSDIHYPAGDLSIPHSIVVAFNGLAHPLYETRVNTFIRHI